MVLQRSSLASMKASYTPILTSYPTWIASKAI
nr:MAG TPA: hypothetical protein [Caudoviricetes sp.]DAP97100.1 MAG TPA: hypothetical protein [Caudoviricetes sp.]DAW82958.1 MAG TPA: hypothetical protein [Caudoviricetes sp.]